MDDREAFGKLFAICIADFSGWEELPSERKKLLEEYAFLRSKEHENAVQTNAENYLSSARSSQTAAYTVARLVDQELFEEAGNIALSIALIRNIQYFMGVSEKRALHLIGAIIERLPNLGAGSD